MATFEHGERGYEEKLKALRVTIAHGLANGVVQDDRRHSIALESEQRSA
jgi:hypothetical protein